MIGLTLAEVAEATGGRLVEADPAARVSSLTTDSRTAAPGALFVALRGSRADGSAFAGAALAAGAVATLAAAGAVAAGPRVEVADPLAGLAAVAGAVRARARARVVGITGSTGKTTTKDLLAAVLATTMPVVANPASFNNEVGLPLTLARLEPDSRALVVELGARGRGHIAELCRLARPEVGVVLNVGEAHLGMFGSRAAIAKAKGELVEALPAGGTAVLNADDPLVAAMAERTAARVVTFGLAAGADVRAEQVALDEQGRARFLLVTPAGRVEVRMPAAGEHLTADALAAAAAAGVLGVALPDVAAGIASARLSPMRMQVSRRRDGLTVINDAYNANPTSMLAALKALVAARRPGGRTVAVLGEMAELGEASTAEHDRIGRLAARLGVDRLVGVGPLGRVLVDAARMEGMWPEEARVADDPEAALAALAGFGPDEVGLGPDDVVLVKASRAVALDVVATRLLDAPPPGRPSCPSGRGAAARLPAEGDA